MLSNCRALKAREGHRTGSKLRKIEVIKSCHEGLSFKGNYKNFQLTFQRTCLASNNS